MKNKNFLPLAIHLAFCMLIISCNKQTGPVTDVNTPLHMLQPDYVTPYGIPKTEDVKAILDRIFNYLDKTTPAKVVDGDSNKEIGDPGQMDENSKFMPGDFRICSYEWGVTYAGMLLTGEITGDKKYTDYTVKRLDFLSDVASHFRPLVEKDPDLLNPARPMLTPHALDDAGAMCAAMIKTERAGLTNNLRPIINHWVDYISSKEFRLADGTLARNRPLPNTIWLDDLFMSVPALAQMGKLTGENKYYEDAVKQVLQFSERMFNHEKGVFMHGWVQDMEPHPQFHWARANGWAVMTMVELLEVLPKDFEGYDAVLGILREHIQGLARYQSGEGFWHQLLDRQDSYLETSATAIYTYAIARAINRGYVDVKAYSPAVLLAWNAVSTKINEKGQVEGTCVGTGMAFDPAFYYYRPVSPYAAHGYGPVILAGAEVIALLNNFDSEINDSALMMYEKENK
ncbi:MAG: glycoside hydrolase family 88 protein [Bacteroidales bacterium]|nr:glycoside hydrolase family 88 protein [Bacteroidales bacterium]